MRERNLSVRTGKRIEWDAKRIKVTNPDDAITADELEDYATLVLPNVTSLYDEQIEAIEGFVSRGDT